MQGADQICNYVESTHPILMLFWSSVVVWILGIFGSPVKIQMEEAQYLKHCHALVKVLCIKSSSSSYVELPCRGSKCMALLYPLSWHTKMFSKLFVCD